MRNKKILNQEQNQEKVWNALAEQWFHFRQRPFPSIAKWIEKLSREWKPGKILEIGCGNCRNLLLFAKAGFDCYGVDFSQEMLNYAKKYIKKHNFKVKLRKARAEKLPFANESFDYILYIAVLHHIQSKEDRKKSLQEIKRVLKHEGQMYISVWNKLIKRFILKPKNYYVPWSVKGKIYYRYYYLFTYWELRRLLKKAGFKIIKGSGFFQDNLWFLVKK